MLGLFAGDQIHSGAIVFSRGLGKKWLLSQHYIQTLSAEALKVPYVLAAYIKYILYVPAVYYLNEADPQYDQPNSCINLIK